VICNDAGTYNFSVGTILSRSFSILFKHPFVFTGLSILVYTPVIITTILLRDLAAGELITSTVGLILGFIIQGAFTCAVYEVLRGNPARFGESLLRGTTRIMPVILAALPITVVFVIVGSPDYLETIIGVNLTFVVVLPGLLILIWLLCKWATLVPAIVVEHLGPMESLNRSSELTKGYRWKIFAILILQIVTFTFFSYIFSFVFRAFISEFDPVFLVALERLSEIIPNAFGGVMTAVIYFELRKVKDRISIDSLSRVFD